MRASPIVTLACAAVLAGAAGPAMAAAATPPAIELPEFTKGERDTSLPDLTRITVRWRPPVFVPQSAADRVELTVRTPIGSADSRSSGATASTKQSFGFGFSGLDGQPVQVVIAWCVSFSGCPLGPAILATSTVDATPPSATLRIDGGAPFTNDRDVSLDIAAEDPLIRGRAGTSSGITQVAVDSDGDGVYPCSLIFAGDSSGCARAFAPAVPLTLTEGDGPKTVGVTVGDGAREITAPCSSRFCVGILGQPILGNASAVTDTIVLDTTPPVAAVTQDPATASAGRAVTFSAAPSSDPGTSPSGADPATATWDFGDGSPTVTGADVTHTYAAVGTFTGRMTVADRAGNRSAPRQFTVDVTAPPAPAAATATTPARPLTLSGLRTACARRVAASRTTPAACRRQVVLTLSTEARLRLTFRAAGAKSKVVGRLSRTGTAGVNRIAVPATLLGKLGVGRHMVQVTATAGGTTTPVRAVTLVVPPAPKARRA